MGWGEREREISRTLKKSVKQQLFVPPQNLTSDFRALSEITGCASRISRQGSSDTKDFLRPADILSDVNREQFHRNP